MAKKDKKKKNKQQGSDAADAVEAVRSAVERTFQATTEGAGATQKRTRALVDEVAHAASRIRETIEDLKILEDVRGLRSEIEALGRRVAALEIGQRGTPSRPAPAKRATAAKRSPVKRAAKRSATAKRAPTVKSKPAAKTRAKAKSKPRAKPSASSSS
jgi:polyhydroxyalkanoate synthesis regulator phasin